MLLAALLSLPGAAPAPGAEAGAVPSATGASHSASGFARRLSLDARALLTSPRRWNRRQWGLFAAGAAVVGVTHTFDSRVRTIVRRDSDEPEDLRFPRRLRPLGQEGGLAALGGLWMVGEAFHRPEAVATARDGLEATLLAAGVVAPLIKTITGRARPRSGSGPSSFRLLDGGTSFPSGEAAEAFAIASVVAARTRHRWLRASVWGLAAVTGWERVRLDGHWASDVVTGAALGTAVGRWVVHRHRTSPPTSHRRIDLLPEVGRGTYGLALHLSW